jgi:hypothetical protein
MLGERAIERPSLRRHYPDQVLRVLSQSLATILPVRKNCDWDTPGNAENSGLLNRIL